MISIVSGILTLMVCKTSEFTVTNKRVLMKSGIFSRRSFETLLSKIESIEVDQPIVGRMFDYGTIVIYGTGASKNPFRHIENPFEFRMVVQEQIETMGG